MIGRLPHPLDATRTLYVSLLYREASGEWRPLHGRYFATEHEAFRAGIKEVTRRAELISTGHDELTVNLDRLLDAVGMEDLVYVGRVPHRLDMTTGLLAPVDEPVLEGVEESSEEVVMMEEVIESLTRARQRTRKPLSIERLRRLCELIGKLADDWELMLAKPDDEAEEPNGNAGKPDGNAGKPGGNAGKPDGNAGKPGGNAGNDGMTE